MDSTKFDIALVADSREFTDSVECTEERDTDTGHQSVNTASESAGLQYQHEGCGFHVIVQPFLSMSNNMSSFVTCIY